MVDFFKAKNRKKVPLNIQGYGPVNLKVQKREWNGSLTDQIVNLLLNFARMQSKIDICHGKSKTPLACSNIIKQKSDQSFNLFGYFLIF